MSLFVLFMSSAELHYNIAIALLRKPPWLPPRKLHASLVNCCTTAILSASSGIGVSLEGRSHRRKRQLGYTIILNSG